MKEKRDDREFSLIFDEENISVMKQISEGIPGGFFIYHADGNEELIHINSAMLRIFGCDTEEEFRELTGFTFRGMVHPEDIDKVEESIAAQIENSIYDLDYVEYRIIQKDGNIRWVEDYGHFIHTEKYGSIFCVFIEDATERLKTRMTELENVNDALRSANARERQYKKAILYDTIFFFEINLTKDEFIHTGISTANIKKNELFDFLGRQSFEKYSDYVRFWSERTESNGPEDYSQFFNPERLIRCYSKGEPEQTFDGWITDAFGRRRLCHYIILIGKDEYSGDIVALFIAKDITEQEEKQSLLKSALRQAESAKLTRNAFLFNMSHDIRTPLNAIIGYTDLVKDHLSEKDKVEEYMKKIRISGEQLLAIVDESLEVSRMESGKVNLTESECHLGDLLEEVERLMLPEIRIKGIHFYLDSSKVEHFAVVADFIRIREILCQLLDNAVKYTNSNGEIRLSVVETGLDFPGYGKYQFHVEDNGIGISEEFMGMLFDPFKRENNTTQSGVLGTGLGLTLVKSLVDLMEGEIAVFSIPGKGSTFTVSLLLKQQKEQHIYKSAAEPFMDKSAWKGKRILLVEDNEINREIAQELLQSQGFLVETAENGSFALEMVRNSQPGYYLLVLMDIQMPVMDGYEATRAIRKLENTRLAHIPIIALSANAFAEDYQKSLEAGMDAHFPKPVDMKRLQEMMQTVLYEHHL